MRGEANGVTVYDDFALTRRRFWQRLRRCVAKLVVRAHYCRAGTALKHHENGDLQSDLAPSLGRADEVFLLQPAHIRGRWQKPAFSLHTGAAMWIAGRYGGENRSAGRSHSGDEYGGFGGIHQKLLDGLAKKAEARSNSQPQPDRVCVGRIRRSAASGI